jgi:hypothetical protein
MRPCDVDYLDLYKYGASWDYLCTADSEKKKKKYHAIPEASERYY